MRVGILAGAFDGYKKEKNGVCMCVCVCGKGHGKKTAKENTENGKKKQTKQLKQQEHH